MVIYFHPMSNGKHVNGDDENRNTLVQLPSGLVNTYVYNGDGLRFQKQDSSGATQFVWDGQAYLAETDGNNVQQAEYTSEAGQFGGLVIQRRLTSGLWAPSYYQFDGLGSTIQLTNSRAQITDNYLYTAFGNQILNYTGPTVNPFRWVGQVGYYYDPDTGNCYVRARIYIPVITRWASQGPIGFAGGDWNLYRYVGNVPVNRIDPLGLRECFCDCKGLTPSTSNVNSSINSLLAQAIAQIGIGGRLRPPKLFATCLVGHVYMQGIGRGCKRKLKFAYLRILAYAVGGKFDGQGAWISRNFWTCRNRGLHLTKL